MRALVAVVAACSVILVMALVVVPGVQKMRAESKYKAYVECLDAVDALVAANYPDADAFEQNLVANGPSQECHWAPRP